MPLACRRRSSSPPRRARRHGFSMSSTRARPSGLTTRSRRAPRRCGSRWDRPLADRRRARLWSRAAGLASVGWGLVVWVFGESFGGIFAPGPHMVVRRAGRGAVVRGRRGACRAARTGLADTQGRSARPGRDGDVLHRHGRAAGLARARLLAGHRGRPAGHPHRHGAVDGPDVAAARAVRPGLFLRVVRRRARVRGEPVHGDRAGRARRGVPAGRPGWPARR